MPENFDPTYLNEIQSRLSYALNRSLSIQDTQLLLLHLRYVLEANEIMNLTSISDEENGILLHIEDSLTALQEIDDLGKGKLVDLGSGGGFPGIPLAIVSKRETTLVEATQKKASVLERFVHESKTCEQITVEAKRIEEYSRTTREYFTIATARALAPLSTLMELAAPLLATGGALVAYKGKLTEEELQRARGAEDILGMELQSIRSFVLSDNETQRELVVFKKARDPKVALPRRNGKAQKSPF